MAIEKIQVEVTFYAKMPNNGVEADDRADEIGDEIIGALKNNLLRFEKLDVIVDSFAVTDWTSRPEVES